MSTDVDAAKVELVSMFPQYSEETIMVIYDSAVKKAPTNDHILPLCIETLLKLPDSESGDSSSKGFINKDGKGLDRNDKEHNGGNSSSRGYNGKDMKTVYRNGKEHKNKTIPQSLDKHRKNNKIVSSSCSSSSDSDNEISKKIRFSVTSHKKASIGSPSYNPSISGKKRKLNEIVSPCANSGESSGTGEHLNNRVDIMDEAPDRNNSIDEMAMITKEYDGFVDICKKKVTTIINNVDETYLEKLINEQSRLLPVPEVVNSVIEYLFENEDYPTAVYDVDEDLPSTSDLLSTSDLPSTSRKNLRTNSQQDLKYDEHSIIVLQNDFPKVSTNVIRKVFKETKNYTMSFNTINSVLEVIKSGKTNVKDTIIKSFLRSDRSKINFHDLCDSLSEEIKQIKTMQNTNQHDTQPTNNDVGEAIECGCCYNEVSFHDMIQCIEGHLFCVTCLQNYSKEAIYGSGKLELTCMTADCKSIFPLSQLKKALDETMLDKYMERVQSEDLKLANIKNLIKCPGCEFAAEMDDDIKVLRCQNPTCLKESCRYCKEDWKNHIGLHCQEIEKKETTTFRTSYEEKMTQAKVRKCGQCDTIFLKSDGCNKMTCRCGAKICYICHKSKIDYNHFCEHPRNPGEKCDKCKKCSLWTDPSEDDDRAVAEIKKQAEEEGMQLGGKEKNISVGPSSSTSTSAVNNNGSNRDTYEEYYGSSEDSDDDSSMVSLNDSDSCHDSDGYESMHGHGNMNFSFDFDGHNHRNHRMDFSSSSSSSSDSDDY